MVDFEELMRKAENGDANAQCELANNFVFVYHFFRALNGGRITMEMANYYIHAFSWFKKAAYQDHAEAQFKTANCYFYGTGIRQNFNEAFYWYCRAASNGVVAAQVKISLCYSTGVGVTRNYDLAFKWASKAAESGDATALCSFALFFKDGISIPRNKERAISLLREAYSKGDEKIKEKAKRFLEELGEDISPSPFEKTKSVDDC